MATQPPSYVPEDVPSWDEFYYGDSPEARKARKQIADLPEMVQGKILKQLEEDYTRKANAKMAGALTDTIPAVIDEATIDPDSDVDYYETGDPLDLSGAKDELWDPSDDMPEHSAAYDLDFSTDKGRLAAEDTLGYYDELLAGDGRDAVSEAEYERQRADALQAARSQREAALMNLQEQGRGGGGAALMAELQGASDISRDANVAALGASATRQQRRDDAADARGGLGMDLYGANADIGLGKSAAEDDWKRTIGEWEEGLGINLANLEASEATTNFGRTNLVNDENTGLRNDVTFRNKGLPLEAFSMFQGAGRDERGEYRALADEIRDERRYQESKPGVLDYVGSGLEIAGQAYGLADQSGAFGGKQQKRPVSKRGGK